MQVGDTLAWERTFTREDLEAFTRLSGDTGNHHFESDEQGRFMVQGLLTATLPTKIGGDINLIARQMVFEFRRPVFTGDTIRCEVTVTGLDSAGPQTLLDFAWVCRNQNGKEVMTGEGHGIIRAAAGDRTKEA